MPISEHKNPESDVSAYTDRELADRLAQPLLIGAVGGRAELVILITAVNVLAAVWVAVAVVGAELKSGWFWIPAVTAADVLTLWVGAGIVFAVRNVRAALLLRPIQEQLIEQRRARRAAAEPGDPAA
ncbi:hypothetical protein ACFVU2_19375 [Leifsonia sp. NPDC058194]|uniref:hypothetical protein n=1 Tax=Leifsonia sp. NPDC058194 TaxID=3346374 RepID=UPI0036DBFA55